MSLWNSPGRTNRPSFIPQWSVRVWQKMEGLTGTAFSREVPLWWTPTAALGNSADWCHSEVIWKNPADQYVLISICCFVCVKRHGVSQVQRAHRRLLALLSPSILGMPVRWHGGMGNDCTPPLHISCQSKRDWGIFLEAGSHSHRQGLAVLWLLLVPAPPSFSPSVFSSGVAACSECLPLLLLCFLLASP